MRTPTRSTGTQSNLGGFNPEGEEGDFRRSLVLGLQDKSGQVLKLITILGDSLALPRPEVSYTDGYPARLSLHLGNEFLVVNKARRNNTVVKQSSLAGEGYAWEDIIYMHESRYFIIHLGIVDCAPRIFSPDERRLLGILRRLPSGGYITNYVRDIRSTHRRFFTKHFPKVYVDNDSFAAGLSAILSMIQTRTSAKRAFIINIADTSSVNKGRSFGFTENIRDYNEIIRSVSHGYPDKASVIDIHAETVKDPALLVPDGIHLSVKGHGLIAEYLSQRIAQEQR